MRRVFIVRHGNTFLSGEPPRRIGAGTDLLLTPYGIEQAQALGTHFARLGVRFDIALCSPLKRAQETAAQILAAQDAPRPDIQTAGFLNEIDHGPDENLQEDKVRARIGTRALKAWDEKAIAPPGWRVEPEMRKAGWAECLRSEDGKNPSGTVLAVTSNGAARFAPLSDLSLQGQAKALDSLKLRTCGYGEIHCALSGRPELISWNMCAMV